jgi:glycosyltransferase involved in cell wall biosynthesis
MLLFSFKTFFRIYFYFFNFSVKKEKVEKGRVVYINTHDKGGGAAKVCNQLLNYFKKSSMFVLVKRTDQANIQDFDPRLWSRIGEYALRIEKKYGIIDFSKLGLIRLVNQVNFQKSEIVHLHNTHGYYISFLAMEVAFSSKKVVWTLHDDYMITGHCSFSMTCDKWKRGCENCSDLKIYPALDFDSAHINQIQKEILLKKIQPCIVTPSKWLENRVREKYPFLKNVQTIFNGVNTTIFFPIEDKKSLRTKYEIASDRKIILFIAELSTNNPFKGGEIVRSLLELDLPNDWLFITVGDKQVQSNNTNHFTFPYISSDAILNELYNLADVMIYPTKADNLPLVVLESMSCGIPVIASAIGGINEIIDDRIDGFLVQEFKLENYFKSLTEFFFLEEIFRNQISYNARVKILKLFDENKMYQSYSKLYDQLSQSK